MAIAPSAIASAQDCAKATCQMAVNVCADQAYGKTAAELNAVYNQLI